LFNGPTGKSQSPKPSLLGLKEETVFGTNKPSANMLAVGEAL
jgi:hypothetical protein